MIHRARTRTRVGVCTHHICLGVEQRLRVFELIAAEEVADEVEQIVSERLLVQLCNALFLGGEMSARGCGQRGGGAGIAERRAFLLLQRQENVLTELGLRGHTETHQDSSQ